MWAPETLGPRGVRAATLRTQLREEGVWQLVRDGRCLSRWLPAGEAALAHLERVLACAKVVGVSNRGVVFPPTLGFRLSEGLRCATLHEALSVGEASPWTDEGLDPVHRNGLAACVLLLRRDGWRVQLPEALREVLREALGPELG